jgi:hypothetical protein
MIWQKKNITSLNGKIIHLVLKPQVTLLDGKINGQVIKFNTLASHLGRQIL